MSDESPQERKIIIDEDWKSRVDREREEARQKSAPPADQTTAGQEQAAAQEEFDYSQLPPPSFLFLVSSLATQAMAALGQLPDPVSGQPELRLPLAKHHIETLAMLEEKTKGNLTSDEANQLEAALHDLRMLFVAVQQQVK